MCSPASAIFASIVTVLVCFEAILKSLLQESTLKVNFKALKCIKIPSKLTSILTILVNVALAGEHIFQVLAKYL